MQSILCAPALWLQAGASTGSGQEYLVTVLGISILSLLVAAGLVPSAPVAVAFLLVRASLSQMDVPVRQAFVMAVVPPEERAAASSVTNVPRSLAAAVPPLVTGAMLSHSAVGWPLVCGGLLKVVYDLLLLAQFRAVPPSAE